MQNSVLSKRTKRKKKSGDKYKKGKKGKKGEKNQEKGLTNEEKVGIITGSHKERRLPQKAKASRKFF